MKLALAARGCYEAGFTQPLRAKFALLSILYIGFSLLFGTHVECKTICFLRKPRPQRTAFSNLFRTAIDDLILFEHQGGNSIRIKRARTNGPN